MAANVKGVQGEPGNRIVAGESYPGRTLSVPYRLLTQYDSKKKSAA